MGLRPTWMEVRLDNVRANYRAIRGFVFEKNPGAVKKPRVFGVIKANGYSLGAVPVAWALKQEGLDYFIVATADEALELRAGGITDAVLVLGASPYEAAEAYVKNDIRASLTDLEMARILSKTGTGLGKKAPVHVKVDTGMGRIGFPWETAAASIAEIAALPGILCEGVFTHFSTSDGPDLTYTEEQYRRFVTVLEEVAGKGITIPIRHCCNSGGTLSRPEWAMDGVRPGQLVAGMYPSGDVPRTIPILPGFAFKTAVSALRTVPSGRDISYGRTYTTSSEELHAVLPVGYADGFDRRLSNKADVLVRGKRCPVVGRICMDQCVVNVSGVPGIAVGDEVVLIGAQGDEEISIYEYAEKMGTIVPVVGGLISARVPRRYVDRSPNS